MKIKKLFSIGMPIILVGASAISASVALVSCNSNKGVKNIDVDMAKVEKFASQLSDKTKSISMDEFNKEFSGQEKAKNIEQDAKELGILSKSIESIIATGDPENAVVTIKANANYKFVSKSKSFELFETKGAISPDGKSIVFTGVKFLTKVVDVKKANIASYATELDNKGKTITKDEYNQLFSGEKKLENIKAVADILKIDQNVIKSIVASGDDKNATVTISAADDYKFVEQDKSLNQSAGGVSSDGRSIVFTGVVFLQKMSVVKANIASYATELDNKGKTITKDEYNQLFSGEKKLENIKAVADILGIVPESIKSIAATGDDNKNATVTISAADDYKFVEQDKSLNQSAGSVSSNGRSIVFTGVVFLQKISVVKANIEKYAAKLDQDCQKTTEEDYNKLFSGEQKLANIKAVADILGIVPESIKSIAASGNFDDATVTISVADNYKFVEQGEVSILAKVAGSVSPDGNSIVFTGVVFKQ